MGLRPTHGRGAGVSPAVAWASCPRVRERDAPATAGETPAPQTTYDTAGILRSSQDDNIEYVHTFCEP
jgi:hypothetical protein